MQKSGFYIQSQNCTFQNSCPPVCLFMDFPPFLVIFANMSKLQNTLQKRVFNIFWQDQNMWHLTYWSSVVSIYKPLFAPKRHKSCFFNFWIIQKIYMYVPVGWKSLKLIALDSFKSQPFLVKTNKFSKNVFFDFQIPL